MASEVDTTCGQTYTIQGVQVQFPYRAYASQLAMMDKILQGLRNSQHCLLESPTGSGKSLALLCAALAWLQNEKDLIREEDEDFEFTRVPDPSTTEFVDLTTTTPTKTTTMTVNSDSGVGFTSPVTPKTLPKIDYDDDDDFEPTSKNKFRQNKTETPMKTSTNLNPSVNLNSSSSCCSTTKVTTEKNQQQRRRVSPKIYFGTRTHKQIAQIIRELDKTEYRSTKMSILGSRDHTCVHPKVSKEPNKNDLCQELLDSLNVGCLYFNKANKLRSAQTIVNPGLKVPWDLEDMTAYGKQNHVCPYFLTRFMKDSADIVFCPYNYIIDPKIRESMDINLKHNILILDEAHNMEDSARSAASFSVSTVQLQAAMNDLEKITIVSKEGDACNALASKLSQLLVWLDKASKELYDSNKTWTGVDFVAVLRVVGWGPEDYARVSELIQCVRETDPDPRKKEQYPQLNAATLNVLTGLNLILGYIFKDNFVHIDDYRIVVTKTFSNESRREFESAWKSRRSSNVIITLNFWCLNPAVAFSEIGQDVRSIVLTSGTLSPLISFESELNIPFKIKLEANHVIHNSQVWVGTIGHSDGCNLNGCFRNSETFQYQDEIGKLVHRICQVTPHGVLCFFPSYSLLDKLTVRWQETGLWCQLESIKVVLSEPRSSVKKEFDDVIRAFYGAVEASVKSGGERGAIFFAVCRGKVSEGLDFTDDNARAVITVGIPFSNIKSLEVTLKRDYNNVHSRKRNLLSGAEWYEIQAFRALNQALGRCIRHKGDWGALIMIDDRLTNTRYTNSLSKWVRTKVKMFPNAGVAISSLTTFMNQRKVKIERNGVNESTNHVKIENASGVVKKENKDCVDRTQMLLSDFGVLPKCANTKLKDEETSAPLDALKRFLFKRQSVKVAEEPSPLNASSRTEERCSSPLLFDSEIVDQNDRTSPVITSNSKRLSTTNGNIDESYRKKIKLEDCVEPTVENGKKFSVFCKGCDIVITKDITSENFSPRGPTVLNQLDSSHDVGNSFIVVNNIVDVLSPKDTSGSPLNAIYDDKDGCCFQILVCNSCHQSIALKVLISNHVSIYSSGEIWLNPSSIRIEEI